MDEAEGELGTTAAIREDVHASGALSRLSEYLVLLLSRREIFDSKLLLSLPSKVSLTGLDPVSELTCKLCELEEVLSTSIFL